VLESYRTHINEKLDSWSCSLVFEKPTKLSYPGGYNHRYNGLDIEDSIFLENHRLEELQYDYAARGNNPYLPHMRHFRIQEPNMYENDNVSDLSSVDSLYD
jgi:hypothetical protein